MEDHIGMCLLFLRVDLFFVFVCSYVFVCRGFFGSAAFSVMKIREIRRTVPRIIEIFFEYVVGGVIWRVDEDFFVRMIAGMDSRIIFLFCALFFSFWQSDAVNMNRIIIPPVKVIRMTEGIHRLFVCAFVVVAIEIDVIVIRIAMVVGYGNMIIEDLVIIVISGVLFTFPWFCAVYKTASFIWNGFVILCFFLWFFFVFCLSVSLFCFIGWVRVVHYVFICCCFCCFWFLFSVFSFFYCFFCVYGGFWC
jgi:hypothetical protein